MRRVCHDLRQYVAAGAMLTAMPGDEELPPEAKHRLQRLSEVFEALSQLIDAQLRTSPGEPAPTDLVHLVDSCVGILAGSAPVQVVTEATGPVVVSGDAVQLRRAISNVLDNAQRAAGPSGCIQVRVGREGSVACVEVVDDGSGFGGVAAGQGLGMAVVGSVIRACHGRLEITSGPGPGTCVRMVFPLAGAVPAGVDVAGTTIQFPHVEAHARTRRRLIR